jgi:two-component system response regulator YesN
MYKVMIVDDEPLFRDYMRSKLDWASHGFRICCEAPNGREALEEAAQYDPDLAFIDISMPHIDGLQLAEQLKRTHPNMCIVFVTGHSEFDYARKAIRLGVQDYLLKPFNKEEFTVTLLRVKKALDDLSIYSDRTSLSPPIDIHTMEVIDTLSFEAQETIILSLRMREFKALEDELHRVLQDIRRTDITSNSAHKYLGALLNLCLSFIIESGMTPEQVWGTAFSPEQQLNHFHSWDEAEAWVIELYRKSLRLRENIRPSKSYRLFLSAKTYIRENYHDPELSVEGVAQALFIDPSYLRKVFKKEARISAVDYITYTRMKEAKELLVTGQMKLSAIAEKLGYNDPNYFSKCFKKRFGISPSEFEQLHKK